jgi:hypothetical protein
MDPTALPMLPACTLDQAGSRRQLDRYRAAGQGASLIERTRRRLTLELGREVDRQLVEELLATERECCPFFDVTWDRHQRRLTFAVSDAEHEPALGAISFAFDLDVPDGRERP